MGTCTTINWTFTMEIEYKCQHGWLCAQSLIFYRLSIKLNKSRLKQTK